MKTFYPTGRGKILPANSKPKSFFHQNCSVEAIILSFGTKPSLVVWVSSGHDDCAYSKHYILRRRLMKQNRLLIAGSVLAAAWMTTGTAMAQSSSSGSSSGSAQSTKEVHPSVNTSKGQSKSERADETGTPLPKGSPYAGTVEKGKSSSADSGMDTSTSPSARGTSSGRMARSGSA